jgi:hypothetical protein
MEAVTTKKTYRAIVLNARFNADVSTLLPNILISSEFLKAPITEKITIAIVVVLSPPPVETGEAPMNINIIVKILLLGDRFAMLRVLNPAVRDVTDWKSEGRNL